MILFLRQGRGVGQHYRRKPNPTTITLTLTLTQTVRILLVSFPAEFAAGPPRARQ